MERLTLDPLPPPHFSDYFSDVLMNILSDFVPHKLSKFNCKQPPYNYVICLL